MKIKKGIFIALSVIATAGVSYFIYTKIKDRNKEIIRDGGFTIKVSDDATTTTDFDDIDIDDDIDDNDDNGSSYDYDYGYGYDYGEAAWTYIYDDEY